MKASVAGSSVFCMFAILGCAQAAEADMHAFRIPAGNAEDAIAALSRQSGRYILSPGETLIGITTPALLGSYSTEAALHLLLKNTPVEIVSTSGHTIILRRRAMPAPALPVKTEVASSLDLETVTITGFRKSLVNTIDAKRMSTGFDETVFAEGIGKFPDTNIAEALNRVPGITILREINGEGVNIQIRGLGTNFTKVLLNGNPIAVASTGATDATNTNREVDLNMFPAEMFTQLSVSKTLSADQIEGGASGIVSMRSMRPFDHDGFHLAYNLQMTDQSGSGNVAGKRGTFIVSQTYGSFGILLGMAGVQSPLLVSGWEDGNAGWISANLPPGACGADNRCNQFGSGAWTIAATVPSGVYVPVPAGYSMAKGYNPVFKNGTAYFPENYPVSAGMLYALNPQLADDGCTVNVPSQKCLDQAMTRLSNTLLPRLGRPMYETGTRDRYSAMLSLEYRPSETLQFYNDLIFSRAYNHLVRNDVGWGVRGGNSAVPMIPANLSLSPQWLSAPFTGGFGGAAQSGTFYNATFGLEFRPYDEDGDFLNMNPGVLWQATPLLRVDVQANYSRSHFLRNSPTILFTSCTSSSPAVGIDNCPNGPPSLGTVLEFHTDGTYPTQQINLNLNDPGNYEWNLGRVNLAGEKRYVYTLGAHTDITYGGDVLAVKVGGAYDESYRMIASYEYSSFWQAAICGGNPNIVLLGPNSPPAACTGQAAPAVPAGWVKPPYPGLGTGYSTGVDALTFGGSLIPTSKLADYLYPSHAGFVSVDYHRMFRDSGYYPLLHTAISSMQCLPHCHTDGYPDNAVLYPAYASYFDERTTGLYGKLTGTLDVFGHDLRYDTGVRWFETRQLIVSAERTADPRNALLQDGGYYPTYNLMVPATEKYNAWLPSLSLALNLRENVILRAALSRSMNRPNPNDMSSVMSFNDPSAAEARLGNPRLKPYYSDNVDLGLEYYTRSEGYVGISAFHKSISGFSALLTIERNFAYLAHYGIFWNTLAAQQQLNYQTSGGPSGVPCNSDASCADHPLSVIQQVNLPGLKIINGVELDALFPLETLSGGHWQIPGLGFAGNVTFIRQGSTGLVPVYALDVPNTQYNVTGYYEVGDVMVRLSYNWNGHAYGTSSNNQNICFPASDSSDRPTGCPQGAYIFRGAYGQADLSSSLKLRALFGDLPSDPSFTFDVQNLFNARIKSYTMLPDAVHSYYKPGFKLAAGIRGTF